MTDFSLFFNQYFEVKTGPDNDIGNEAFRLRYQVYCLERQFESHASCIDRKESDHFDSHALHGIVRHRESGLTVATVRLVRRPAGVADSVFPLQEAYPDLLLQHGLTNQVLPRSTTAEISRFAISRKWQRYLRSQRDQAQSSALARAGWLYRGRCYPLVTFGLFVALMRLSAQNGITHWLAIMEPSLLRLLGRFGIGFESIGGLVDYHGKRQPCYGRVDDINDCVRETEWNLFDLVQRDLTSAQPNAYPATAGCFNRTRPPSITLSS